MSDAPSIPRRLGALALPDDPTLEAAPSGTRALVARVWGERVRSELAAAQAFTRVAQRAIAAGLPREVQYLAARAVADEVRHAALCAALAERAGAAPSWPSPPPPRDAGDDTALFVSSGCIQETLGSAFLQATLERAESPAARFVARALLADEVDHARIGWAWGAGLDETGKVTLGARLHGLLAACLGPWRARLDALPAAGAPAFGVLAPATIRAEMRRALEELVLPGFAHLGVPTGDAARAIDALG